MPDDASDELRGEFLSWAQSEAEWRIDEASSKYELERDIEELAELAGSFDASLDDFVNWERYGDREDEIEAEEGKEADAPPPGDLSPEPRDDEAAIESLFESLRG